mgnify:FL=1
MTDIFLVEIISPDKTVVKIEASEVTIPSYEGQMGILKDHITLITLLRPGSITITHDNKKKEIFIEEGTVEFANNNLLILSSTVKDLEEFKKNDIEKIIQESEEKIIKNETSDKQRYLLSYKIETLKEINL